MPIRPENRAKYPKDWPEISRRIRFERAEGRCEKMLPGRILPNNSVLTPYRCNAEHGKPHPDTGSTVILTVAHLDHNPENCADENLMAMCQRCHLRYDQHHHKSCDRTPDLFTKEGK